MSEQGVAAARRDAHTVEGAAQAKINLRLRILAREAGGFHQIETLFLRLDLSDTIRLRRTATSRTIDVSGAQATDVGPVEQNLAWRAAMAYADVSNWRGGFALELEKRIPIGGGLGGGSADAGMVLRAFDALAPAPLSPRELLAIAGEIGSDVPFLTSTCAYALAWGRGERMLALEPPTSRPVMLVCPGFSVSTAAAYEWLDSAREKSGARRADHAELLSMAALSRWDSIADLAVNDFEPVVGARHPEIAVSVMRLRRAGCTVAEMSGSGSTVFGVLPREIGGGEQREPQKGEPMTSTFLMTRTATRVEPVRLID